MKPRLYKTTIPMWGRGAIWVCADDCTYAYGKTFALAYAAWKHYREVRYEAADQTESIRQQVRLVM